LKVWECKNLQAFDFLKLLNKNMFNGTFKIILPFLPYYRFYRITVFTVLPFLPYYRFLLILVRDV